MLVPGGGGTGTPGGDVVLLPQWKISPTFACMVLPGVAAAPWAGPPSTIVTISPDSSTLHWYAGMPSAISHLLTTRHFWGVLPGSRKVRYSLVEAACRGHGTGRRRFDFNIGWRRGDGNAALVHVVEQAWPAAACLFHGKMLDSPGLVSGGALESMRVIVSPLPTT